MWEIPARIRITARITYNILWTDEFKNEKQLGECDYENRQIVILKGLNPRQAYLVFIHEVLHAISHHHLESKKRRYALTENQVEELETAIGKIAKYNKLF